MSATLLSIDDHTITYFPFPQIPSQQQNEDGSAHGSFSLSQVAEENVKLSMDYAPETSRLNYSYLNFHFNEGDHDQDSVYSGYFLYSNGQFLFQDETSKPASE
jgi:hypothetical protein